MMHFEQVVGERSGYVKGMRFGPLPPNTRKRLCEELQKEMDHIRRERDKARMEREEARKERYTLTRKWLEWRTNNKKCVNN